MAKIKLTDLKIAKLKPTEKEQNFSDGDGLFLRIRALKEGGGKSFYFQYLFGEKNDEDDGKKKKKKKNKITIGSYGTVTLKEARTIAEEYQAILAQGRDPRTSKGKKVNLTVKELFESWESDYLKQKYADNGDKIKRRFNLDVFPVIGNQEAHTVGADQIQDIVRAAVGRDAKSVGAKLLADMRSMWGYGIRLHKLTTDPTGYIKARDLGAEEGIRERNLSFEEIKILGEKYKSANLPPRAEAAMWILLATGCRADELTTALVEDLDFENKTLLLRATKNRRDFVVHLNEFAIHWLRRLHEDARGGFLMPNLDNDKPLAESYIRKALGERIGTTTRTVRVKGKTIKKPTRFHGMLALPGGDWSPHDLRRTMASRMGDLGIDPHIIDACQNHIPQGIKRHYQHQMYVNERREAFDKWGTKLNELCPILLG